MKMSFDHPPIQVLRYAASGFYDTQARTYLAESVLLAWLAAGIDFVVLDAATGQDVSSDLSPAAPAAPAESDGTGALTLH